MLPKSKRLNFKKDFKWVASGSKLETRFLKMFYRTGKNEVAKLGIALSSKNFKKATDRNRARRLVSQAFQSIFHLLPSTINIIALPKAGVIDVKSSDLALDLEKVLRDEKIIN